MRRAGAHGHAPQRGRPPSPFPGRPEGLTCSPPAPGPAARCALQGLPGSPSQEPCLAGSHLCPAGTRPRPLLTPAGPLRWQKRGRLTFFPRQAPEPRARGRPQLEQPQRVWFRVPESRPRPARSGRAAASAGLRATRSGRREVSGLRPRLRPHTGPRREAQLAAAAPAGRKRGLCDRASRRCPQTGPRCSHLVTCPALNQGWRVRPASERRDGASEGGR